MGDGVDLSGKIVQGVLATDTDACEGGGQVVDSNPRYHQT
jgi:hypothetical protein